MVSIGKQLQAHPQAKAVLSILAQLRAAGYRALLAGGCVRDAALGRIAQDLDVATSATPDQVIALFPKTVEVGKAFGVVRVLHESADVEVASFRVDSPTGDGRRPDGVTFSNEVEDAKRRDFTVNALFYDPEKDEVLDYVGGLSDLAARTLRTVGSPDRRFAEDRLRLLRALRFAVQLDFKIEDITWKSLCEHAPETRSVSGERIRDELVKALKWGRGAKFLELFRTSGLEQALFGHLPPSSVSQEVRAQLLTRVSADRVELFSRLFAPWANAGESRDQVLERLRLSRAEMSALRLRFRWMAEGAQFSQLPKGDRLQLFDQPDVRAGLQMAVETGVITSETFSQLSKEWRAELIGGKLPPPFLTGEDLLPLVKGALLGQALKAVYAAQLEGQVRERGAALTWIQAWLKMQGQQETS